MTHKPSPSPRSISGLQPLKRPFGVYASVFLMVIYSGIIPLAYFSSLDELVLEYGAFMLFCMPILWIFTLYFIWLIFSGSTSTRIALLIASGFVISERIFRIIKCIDESKIGLAWFVGVITLFYLLIIIILFLPSSNRWFAESRR